jgi:hypothetical protein
LKPAVRKVSRRGRRKLAFFVVRSPVPLRQVRQNNFS